MTEVLHVDLTRDDDDGSPAGTGAHEVIDVEAYLMDMISRPSLTPVARIKEEPTQPEARDILTVLGFKAGEKHSVAPC